MNSRYPCRTPAAQVDAAKITSLAELLLVIISTLLTTRLTDAAQSNDNSNAPPSSSSCTLYMAPTSTLGPPNGYTKEFTKLSMYAGTNFQKGQIIGRPEIAIPLPHIEQHNGFSSSSSHPKNQNEAKPKPKYFDTISNFMWNAPTCSAQFEINTEDLLMCIPGVGALGNQHPTLVYNADWDLNANVDRTLPLASILDYDDEEEEEHEYQRGSTSHFFDMTLVAKENIPMGMEILVDDLGIEQDTELNTREEFQSADRAMKQIYDFMKKHDKALSAEGSKSYFSKSSGDSTKKQQMYEFLLRDVLKDEKNELFPEHVDDLEKIMSSADSIFLHSYPELQKSISWLEENGQCIDGIYVKESTILPDQHGAFATRSYKKGDVVAPAPLMMIPEKSYLDVYQLKTYTEKAKKAKKTQKTDRAGELNRDIDRGVVSQQLITNYSFGHRESSILFYPYGMNVNFINHQSSRSEDGKGPNVKLVWTKAKYHDSELLGYSPENLRVRDDDDEIFFRFGMDIVAARDIEVDEEIFLDYGIEWEDEWNRHVENWEREVGDSSIKALELNTRMTLKADDYYDKYYTTDEVDEMQDESKYYIPRSVMTTCYLSWNKLKDGDELNSKKKPHYEVWYRFDENTLKDGHILQPCEIIERHEIKGNDGEKDQYEYTVKLAPDEDGKKGIIYGVPQSFIKYTDRPYSSHVQRHNVFRHYIGIPDEIFPEAWRDLV